MRFRIDDEEFGHFQDREADGDEGEDEGVVLDASAGELSPLGQVSLSALFHLGLLLVSRKWELHRALDPGS